MPASATYVHSTVAFKFFTTLCFTSNYDSLQIFTVCHQQISFVSIPDHNKPKLQENASFCSNLGFLKKNLREP